MNTYFFNTSKAQVALRGHLRQVSKDLFVLTKDGEVREKLMHRKGSLFKSYLGGTPIAKNITLAFERQCIDRAMTEGLREHRKIALNAQYEHFGARRNEFYDLSMYAPLRSNPIAFYDVSAHGHITDDACELLRRAMSCELNGEGEPKSLAKERTRTFTGKAKVYMDVAGEGWRELKIADTLGIAQSQLRGESWSAAKVAQAMASEEGNETFTKAFTGNDGMYCFTSDEGSMTLRGSLKHVAKDLYVLSQNPDVDGALIFRKGSLSEMTHAGPRLIGETVTFAYPKRIDDATDKILADKKGWYSFMKKEVPHDYKHLYSILMSAFDQAASGKGKERHAGGQPFEAQPMQSISDLFDSPHGMAFQVAKKVHEALTALDGNLEAQERELLGAINYTAGIILWLRRKAGKV